MVVYRRQCGFSKIQHGLIAAHSALSKQSCACGFITLERLELTLQYIAWEEFVVSNYKALFFETLWKLGIVQQEFFVSPFVSPFPSAAGVSCGCVSGAPWHNSPDWQTLKYLPVEGNKKNNKASVLQRVKPVNEGMFSGFQSMSGDTTGEHFQLTHRHETRLRH